MMSISKQCVDFLDKFCGQEYILMDYSILVVRILPLKVLVLIGQARESYFE